LFFIAIRKKAFEKKRRENEFAEADKSLGEGEGDVGFEFKIDLNAA
jgi:hypothetical protein